MKKLLPILVVVILAGGYAGYTFAMPHKKPPVPKVNGQIYILPKQFTLNMAGGQYATVTVALLLGPAQSEGTTSASDPPPTGFGSLPEEAVIRAIITNAVTDQPTSSLLTAAGRAKLESNILHTIKTQSDDVITKIYLTDIAVQ